MQSLCGWKLQIPYSQRVSVCQVEQFTITSDFVSCLYADHSSTASPEPTPPPVVHQPIPPQTPPTPVSAKVRTSNPVRYIHQNYYGQLCGAVQQCAWNGTVY